MFSHAAHPNTKTHTHSQCEPDGSDPTGSELHGNSVRPPPSQLRASEQRESYGAWRRGWRTPDPGPLVSPLNHITHTSDTHECRAATELVSQQPQPSELPPANGVSKHSLAALQFEGGIVPDEPILNVHHVYGNQHLTPPQTAGFKIKIKGGPFLLWLCCIKTSLFPALQV